MPDACREVLALAPLAVPLPKTSAFAENDAISTRVNILPPRVDSKVALSFSRANERQFPLKSTTPAATRPHLTCA